MPLTGFEPAISAIERPQTYAIDLTANAISHPRYLRTRYENVFPPKPLKSSVIIHILPGTDLSRLMFDTLDCRTRSQLSPISSALIMVTNNLVVVGN